jgi:hypothetical protein
MESPCELERNQAAAGLNAPKFSTSMICLFGSCISRHRNQLANALHEECSSALGSAA